MNVVLVQEVLRFNGLLMVIHSSLHALSLALRGQVATTSDLEETYDSLLEN